MAKQQRMWARGPSKSPASKLPEQTKALIQQKADELVNSILKPRYIQPPPAPDEFQRNYITDIYTKWYRHHFYFCAKYTVPGPNAIEPFFEAKFARLEYVRGDQFDLAFMRYTGQWVVPYPSLSLEQCWDALENDPLFYA